MIIRNNVEKNTATLPIMYGCPPPCAVVDPYGEEAKDEEEHGHAKAHLIDCRVANQSFAVLPCL